MYMNSKILMPLGTLVLEHRTKTKDLLLELNILRNPGLNVYPKIAAQK